MVIKFTPHEFVSAKKPKSKIVAIYGSMSSHNQIITKPANLLQIKEVITSKWMKRREQKITITKI